MTSPAIATSACHCEICRPVGWCVFAVSPAYMLPQDTHFILCLSLLMLCGSARIEDGISGVIYKQICLFIVLDETERPLTRLRLSQKTQSLHYNLLRVILLSILEISICSL